MLTSLVKHSKFLHEFTQRMLDSFTYVCTFSVKEKYHHQVPKYVLIFATRHPHGILLMNDFMCKARQEFVKSHFSDDRLFDITPEEEIVESTDLRDGILEIISQSQSTLARPEVRLQLLLKGFFARLTQSQINKEISLMLKEGSLYSSTGKARINDEVQLSSKPFS